MVISYNKLWILLNHRDIRAAELRRSAGIAPNTMTRLRKNEEVTLDVLRRICSVLDVNIGDIMDFIGDEN